MPFMNRQHEVEMTQPGARRFFRSPMTDFKRQVRGNGNGNGNNSRNVRTAPPDVTNAENFYYVKQMNSKTPMVIVLTDGEEIRGCIEWYDKSCLKVNRDGAPNLLIQKHCIKYLFKQEELAD
jgi:sRNA-binding regulator protein Hfq